MYPSAFEYRKPADLAELLALLASGNGEVRCLAGGQSLIPSMKLRLAQPRLLLDLAGLAELRGIEVIGRDLVIGAMTTHREVEASPVVRAQLPYLSEVAANIADPQVRNRGTIGGSLANADPAADYPASLLALQGVVEAAGPAGKRDIPADDWPVALMTTALAADEIIVRVRLPLAGEREGAAYVKVPHPASRFAVVGIAARLGLNADGACTNCRIAITGVGETVQLVPEAAAALVGTAASPVDIETACAHLASEVSVMADGLLGEEAKRQLCRMTARKALRQALAIAGR